jgi:hypothetical protein
MRMAPGRGRGHPCWWPLIFKKNFVTFLLFTRYKGKFYERRDANVI